MQNECDVLILTAGFGTGHMAVAQAIKAQLLKDSPRFNVQIVDIYQALHPKGYKAIYRGYELLVRKLPLLYNQYYYGKEQFAPLKKMDTLSKASIKRLWHFIRRLKPKIVISTFPSCTGYMAQYKKRYDNKLPLFTCITDAVCNNEWVYPENDLYFVADNCLKEGLIKRGIEPNKILVTGIPIRNKFLKQLDQSILRKQLGYEDKDRIVLIMGGGLGLLPKGDDFYKWLVLQENIQVIALTSKNNKLYDKLKRINAQNLRIYGFCDQVPEYMKVANLLIGKSGGITLYEAIASQLPLIVYQPKLGQEVENSRFIVKRGIGYVVNNQEDLKSIVILALKSEIQEKLSSNLIDARKSINYSVISKYVRKYSSEKS